MPSKHRSGRKAASSVACFVQQEAVAVLTRESRGMAESLEITNEVGHAVYVEQNQGTRLLLEFPSRAVKRLHGTADVLSLRWLVHVAVSGGQELFYTRASASSSARRSLSCSVQKYSKRPKMRCAAESMKGSDVFGEHLALHDPVHRKARKAW
eukprot:3414539-Amphidinium_carterae.1